MNLFMGLDIGSSFSKGVIINDDGVIVAKYITKSGYSFELAADEIKENLLEQIGKNFKDISSAVSCGYGRKNVSFAKFHKTEITCHARGAFYYFPAKAKIIDIGGQDNKIIEIDHIGNILNFKMNRKCAAGTGAFIEETANRLNIEMNKLESLAKKSTKALTISSFCTVFAQTEIIRLIKEGNKIEDIANAIFDSVSQRIIEMDIFPKDTNIIITGGVISGFPILKDIIYQKTGCNILIPPDAQYCGAFGASLLGRN